MVTQKKIPQKQYKLPRSYFYSVNGNGGEVEDINWEAVQKLIDNHSSNLIGYYNDLKERYIGNGQAIYSRDISDDKPNNKIVTNYSRMLVDSETGYFIGNPVRYDLEDNKLEKELNKFVQNSDEIETNLQLSTQCGIYGHTYELMYQDEAGATKFVYVEPQEIIYIYEANVQEAPLAAIRFIKSVDILDTKKEKLIGTVYTKHNMYEFEANGGQVIVHNEPKAHLFQDLPITEYKQNEYRVGVIELIQSLEDARNQVLSDKVNDQDYFSDALLLIAGVDLSEQLKDDEGNDKPLNLKENRTLYSPNTEAQKTIEVKFVAKPSNDEQQEHTIDHLDRDIHNVSGIPDFSDESFGNASGVALEMKLWRMDVNMGVKQSQFTAALKRRLTLLLQQEQTRGVFAKIKALFIGEQSSLDLSELKIVFTPKKPRDKELSAQIVKDLFGIVSKESLFTEIPDIVNNPLDEIDRINKEKESEALYSFSDYKELGADDNADKETQKILGI